MPARSTAIAVRARLPYLTGTAGALLIALSAILVSLADVSPSTAAVFRCLYALPALALVAGLERRRLGPRSAAERRTALLAGVFFAADLALWHHAIDLVGAGLSTVLANSQVVLVGLAAWAVLGERPERRVLAAVPVVLGGVVLISGALGGDAYGSAPLAGAVFAMLAAVAYAGFLLVLRHGNRDRRRPAGPLLDATASAAVVSVLAGLVVGDLDLVPSWPAHGWLVALALNSQVVGWLLISVSLPRLPAVVTSLLLLLQPVGSLVLGVVLLAEAPSAVQWGGAAVVLAGIGVATLAPRGGGPEPPVDVPAPASSSPR